MLEFLHQETPLLQEGAYGNNRILRLTHIPPEAELMLHDTIETSGLRRNISKGDKDRNYSRNS